MALLLLPSGIAQALALFEAPEADDFPRPTIVTLGVPGWRGCVTHTRWHYAVRVPNNLTEDDRRAGLVPAVSGPSGGIVLAAIEQQREIERTLPRWRDG
jgi:hypothetical protein